MPSPRLTIAVAVSLCLGTSVFAASNSPQEANNPAQRQDVQPFTTIFLSGDLLIQRCRGFLAMRETNDTPADKMIAYSSGLCVGMVVMAQDAIVASIANPKNRGFCVPGGLTATDLTDKVVRHMSAHPEDRQDLAVNMVMKALRATYPCA